MPSSGKAGEPLRLSRTESMGNFLSDDQCRVLGAMDIPLWISRPAAEVAADIDVDVSPTSVSDGKAWTVLQAEVTGCVQCQLHTSRTQTVFGVGNRSADWMIIGEAPGADEDRQGEPFVGRAGQLLNEMLRAVGLDRGQVYIANILKCRPPGNRDPEPEEVSACAGFLNRQVELIRPGLILAVGRIAAQNLLQQDLPVGRLRGSVHRFGRMDIPVVVTYHPAYLLRSPSQKRKAWADLCLARSVAASRAAIVQEPNPGKLVGGE
jgi:uracil-DNA glycosylase family 4